LKIVDCHTHIPFSKIPGFSRLNIGVSEFIRQLKSRGIQKAVVFPYDGLFSLTNYAEDNDRIAEVCKQDPEMLIPYGTVNPNHGKPALDELTRIIQDLGFRGIKLHPWIQTISFLSNETMDPFLQEVERLKVPLHIHDGTPPYSTALQIAYQAARYPKITFVLGHAGLRDFWREDLQAALTYQNLMINANAPFLGNLTIVRQLQAERVVFGSDFPWGGVQVLDYWLGHILELPIDDRWKERILWENAQVLI
jgi:predicted TIM-barrel fold metal-dependent hydrolase